MRCRFVLLAVVGAIELLSGTTSTEAQQSNVGVSNRSIGDSFSERIGTNWGFNSHGVSFRFGGNSQNASGGGRFGVGSGSGFFGVNFAQGSQRGMNSQSPSVTMMNGQSGSFFDSTQSPFVVGFIPVVGGFPTGNVMAGGATTAQLPTYRMFTVSTSVSVPDSGSAALGGVNRAADQGTQVGVPGLPGGRSTSSTRGAGNMQVRAQVHDFAAADEALLGGAPGTAAARRDDPATRALAVQASTAGQGAPSVAELRRMREAEQTSLNDEARDWFERGQTAEKEGKAAVAKTYYNMALRRASGPLKETVLARLAMLRGDTAGK